MLNPALELFIIVYNKPAQSIRTETIILINTMASSPAGVTAVECHKQVRSWRLLRFLIQLLIPTCNSTFPQDQQYINPEEEEDHSCPSITTSSSTITGTIFGYRRGKASFCIQEKPSSPTPLLLLHLPLPTTVLAEQMRGGTLRMVLQRATRPRCASNSCCCTLLSTPLWTLYCNGKKQGYAVKRRPSNVDMEVLRLMRKVDAGAGIMSGKKLNGEDHEVLYLRASFRRVRSDSDTSCEAFHLIDPEGSIGEELSVFFLGST